jgi:hypothetical protein
MGQFLQVNGDYNIKTAEGAKIILDTGPSASGGEVRITGDLVVEGETVSVAATNLNVEDNILIINYYGEDRTSVPSGVILGYAGVEVDRGDLSPAVLLFDETADSWLLANGASPGPFNYDNSNLRLRRIYTNSATDSGDLTLIGTGSGVVKVYGTTDYAQEILDRVVAADPEVDDILTNKKYVDDAILNNPTFQIIAPESQDTRVIIADKEIDISNPGGPGSLAYFTANTGKVIDTGESAVSIIVDNSLIAQFFTNRLEVGDIELGGGVDRNEITTKDGITNENIVIRTQGTGKLQTNYALQLERIGTSGETPGTSPAYVSGSTLLYASTTSIGQTGVWFVNDSLTERYRAGELISKNKALVFSMLF